LLRPLRLSFVAVSFLRFRRMAVPVVALATTTACYRTSARATEFRGADRHTTIGRFYLLGTVGELEVDVRDYCGDRPAARVETTGNPFTVVVTAATLGIYSPRVAVITCSQDQTP